MENNLMNSPKQNSPSKLSKITSPSKSPNTVRNKLSVLNISKKKTKINPNYEDLTKDEHLLIVI